MDIGKYITAGELRDMRINIPLAIPDEAYIPHYGIRYGKIKCHGGEDPNTIYGHYEVEILEPFTYLDPNVCDVIKFELVLTETPTWTEEDYIEL